MLIYPNEHWYWYYAEQQQRLMLALSDDMLFMTQYKRSQLSSHIDASQPFSLDDIGMYHQLIEKSDALAWDTPRRVQLLLNTIAVNRFYRPLMPQSWFFSEQSSDITPEFGDLIWLTTAYEQALFIVALAGNEASVCLSLRETLALNGHKSLSCFDVIKVMNNRIAPFVSSYVQYSNVG